MIGWGNVDIPQFSKLYIAVVGLLCHSSSPYWYMEQKTRSWGRDHRAYFPIIHTSSHTSLVLLLLYL